MWQGRDCRASLAMTGRAGLPSEFILMRNDGGEEIMNSKAAVVIMQFTLEV